jgi:predicted amidophosphoribosyltransferase
MSKLMWKKLDRVENPPAYLESTDYCFYARDYASGKDHNFSEANSLIKNLKKSVKKKNSREWVYKEQAVRRFAAELAALFESATSDFFVAPIPPSTHRNNEEYDPRLDMVLEQLTALCPRARAIEPIFRAKSRTPAHLSGNSRPSVQDVYESLGWNHAVKIPDGTLFLVDDVITAGASFKACQRLIKGHAPAVSVVGVFWARTVWLNSFRT